MKTIATINFKGGVGKTTVTWCLGDVLSLYYRSKILLFDLDAQMSLTQAIALNSKGSPWRDFDNWYAKALVNDTNIFALLKRHMGKGLTNFNPDGQFIYRLKNNYHFIPSTEDLYWLELEHHNPENGKFFIKNLLGRIQNSTQFDDYDQIADYDYVLFDCPPLFTMLSYSVLSCCDLVLIPFNPDFFAARGIGLLISGLRRQIQPHPLPRLGVFANGAKTYAKRPTRALRVWMNSVRSECERARDAYKLDIRFMDAWIPHRVGIRDAITDRRTPDDFVEDFRELWNEARGML